MDKPIFHDEPEKQAQHIENLYKAIDIRDKRISELMYMIGDICKSSSPEQIFERVLKNHEDVKRCIDYKNRFDEMKEKVESLKTQEVVKSYKKINEDEKNFKGNYFV